MCGIIIAKDLKLILKLFDEVIYKRGTDSAGIIDVGTGKWFKTLLQKAKKFTDITGTGLQAEIDGLINPIKKRAKKEKTIGPYIFHNRKASIGAVSVDNAHPFKMKNFILLQNGTNKIFHEWAQIESVIDDDMNDIADASDTYALAKCIEKYPHKKEDILKHAVGVVVIYTKAGEIEIYSDGARSFGVYQTEDLDTYYASQESSKEDQNMVGKLILDTELNVVEDKCDYTFVKKVEPIKAPISCYTPPLYQDSRREYGTPVGQSVHHKPIVQQPLISSAVDSSYCDSYYITEDATTLLSAKRFRKSILSYPNFKDIIQDTVKKNGNATGMKDFINIFGNHLDNCHWDHSYVYQSYKAFLKLSMMDG